MFGFAGRPADELEYEDIEHARAMQRRDASDEAADDDMLADDDLVEVDLDAAPQGEGPDA